MKEKSYISLIIIVILFFSSFFCVAGLNSDFEEGPQGWTTTGFWHWVSPSTSNYPEAHSGVASFWYGLEANGSYGNGQANSGMLISPPLKNPSLMTFWTWWDIEAVGPANYDLMQVTANDGTKYLFLQLNPQESPSDVFGWYSSGGHNVPAVWVKHTVDLRQYPGTNRVIFYFNTVDNYYNDDYYGWYIDDVLIYENSIPIDQIQKIIKGNQDKK